MIELSSSLIKKFNLTLCNGAAVVRNQNRISGLLSVRMSDVPKQFHNLLAKANFTGTVVNEKIIWTTDVFMSEPVRLSELSGQEYQKYSDLLNESMTVYASAISNADESVRKMLYAAITYPSDSAVFCADNRVVITEWGMTPTGESSLKGMPYSIDDKTTSACLNSQPKVEQEVKNVEDVKDDSHKDSSTKDIDITEEHVGNNINTDIESQDNTKDDNSEASNGAVPPRVNDPERNDSSKGKPWWKKLWWLWLLLLLLILAFLAVKCMGKGEVHVIPVTPELGKEDVVLSDDSLRYVASNRLLLLLTDKDADMDKFAKDFAKKYSDSKKYILSNPDTMIKRLTLTLPPEERSKMSESLPEEFASYGLIVVPETMYQAHGVTNDPAMQESDKRWYFDECSVFEAWDTTQGSEDIIVAIIDDGFDLNHPELKGKVVNPYNVVTHDDRVFPSKSGHGTHVAATAIGNANNSAGTAGIAPKCKFMPIQVGDSNGMMSTSAVMDAVVYAIQQGADVVNMSLGMSFGPFVQFAPEYLQKNLRANMFLQEQQVWDYLFDVARQNNVTFVLAGGNENVIIGLDPMQRSNNTIKVSAVQPDRSKASFSNYGDMSTVSAPGVQIYNAIPNGKYTFMDGTSMASPIVAGGCALLLSKDSYLTVHDLARILRETGNPSPSNVGPVVNFANALNNRGCANPEDCEEINQKYQDLLAQLEQLKREHPGCIQSPDTLSLPKDFTAVDLKGRWKSTTSLYNEQNEQVVIYFTFNGTPKGKLEIIEPSGEIYTASLDVAVNNDRVNINQTGNATGNTEKEYNPYRFVLRPDRNRKAAGNAKNKIQAANAFEFNLVRI